MNENMDSKIEKLQLTHWDEWWQPKVMNWLTENNPKMQYCAKMGWTSDEIYDKFEAEYIEFCAKGKEAYEDHLIDQFNSGEITKGVMCSRLLEMNAIKPRDL